MKTELQFDTISNASASTGIPLRVLRNAKKNGSPGFTNGRVQLKPVLSWLFSKGRDLAPALNAQDKLAMAKTRLADHRLKVESGTVIPKTEVIEFIQRTFNPVREQILSMPAVLSARLKDTSDQQEIFSILQVWGDDFLKACKAHTPK